MEPKTIAVAAGGLVALAAAASVGAWLLLRNRG
jgi:hypothetical protein